MDNNLTPERFAAMMKRHGWRPVYDDQEVWFLGYFIYHTRGILMYGQVRRPAGAWQQLLAEDRPPSVEGL